jgi:hypothetical protein
MDSHGAGKVLSLVELLEEDAADRERSVARRRSYLDGRARRPLTARRRRAAASHMGAPAEGAASPEPPPNPATFLMPRAATDADRRLTPSMQCLWRAIVALHSAGRYSDSQRDLGERACIKASSLFYSMQGLIERGYVKRDEQGRYLPLIVPKGSPAS